MKHDTVLFSWVCIAQNATEVQGYIFQEWLITLEVFTKKHAPKRHGPQGHAQCAEVCRIVSNWETACTRPACADARLSAAECSEQLSQA